MLSQAKLLIPG